VFTPVGLFPLAFLGLDVNALLDGAYAWQSAALAGKLAENHAWQLAALHYLLHTRGGATCAVHYIYGDPLVLLGDWFRQLWAESLAKRGTDGRCGGCLTPVVARGTTDQHSQNQLYMDGPNDKVYGFITSERWPVDPSVAVGARRALPEYQNEELQAVRDSQASPLSSGEARLAPTIPPDLSYLTNRTFGEILEACRAGTRDALIEAGRPVYELTLRDLSPDSVGAYMQMWMLATAYAGLLYGVNPFDQPGVERSKVLTKQRLTQSSSQQ
jgi:glucose-6-phosphate isomerase